MIYDHANTKGIHWIDILENFDLINSQIPENNDTNNLNNKMHLYYNRRLFAKQAFIMTSIEILLGY